jgi:ABC-type sugar transport system ATPase subunit
MSPEPVQSSLDDARRPVVQMTAISKRYPGVRALDAVSLVLLPGEIHALAGENGSGKSTLAKILYGAVRADAGRIEMDGVGVSWTSPRQALEKGIVGISQELTLAPTLSVAENVLMGRLPLTRFRAIDWRAARRQTRAVLDELDVHVDPRIRVGDLSVELQQEVEIARAISTEFRVLVLDEATSSLSEAATSRLLGKLEELRRRGAAILFISHRLRELYECADKATVLRDGRLVGEFPLPLVPESELVRSMVGRPIDDLYHKRNVPKGEVLLSVSQLSAPGRMLTRATFDVHQGEIVGIAGLVGSGKAEIGLALGGAISGTGTVTVAGRSARLDTPWRAQAAGVGFVPDDRKREALLPTRTVQHNMSIAWLGLLARAGVLNSRMERRMAREAVERFAIRTRSLDALVTQLSGGNQQKVVLSRWFALDHGVLVLSEPTRGIDVGAKSEVYGFIQDMAEEGRAIVMISSELPELLGIADRILVMYQGRIRASFETSAATEEEIAHVALTGRTAVAA